MLEKIKVYNRNTSDEVDLETVRIGFGESLWLFIGADSSPTEQKFKLTKTDPLNKFKKETIKLLFCDKYIVSYMSLEVSCVYNNYSKVLSHDSAWSCAYNEVESSGLFVDGYHIIGKYINKEQIRMPSIPKFPSYMSTSNNIKDANTAYFMDWCESRDLLDGYAPTFLEKIIENVNPKYTEFENFANSIGCACNHKDRYRFRYESLGDDMFAKLLDIVYP